jgi:hypothetical protein
MTSAPVNGRLLRVSAWVSENCVVVVGCAAGGIWPSSTGPRPRRLGADPGFPDPGFPDPRVLAGGRCLSPLGGCPETGGPPAPTPGYRACPADPGVTNPLIAMPVPPVMRRSPRARHTATATRELRRGGRG